MPAAEGEERPMTFYPLIFGHIELRIDARPPRRVPTRARRRD
jgi:hypothetical protein